MDGWYVEKGPESDVVVSSRVRLARNINNYSFPDRLDSQKAREVVDNIKKIVLESEECKSYGFKFYDMHKLSSLDKNILVEKHLISPDFAIKQNVSGALISSSEQISLMINEEDHLRIQCLFPGMQLENASSLCNRMDDLLESELDYAYSVGYGYLTCCPTNIGTGIRASVMLHLPALVMTGYVRKVLEACGKIGIAVRGIYGENSEAAGNLFQISNQVTLGQDENEIISGLKNVVSQITERERTLRRELYMKEPYRFEDNIYRALGILKNARIISADESLKLFSRVRMGVDMGILKNVDSQVLNELILLVQPACLQKQVDEELKQGDRDRVRADMIRKKLRFDD